MSHKYTLHSEHPNIHPLLPLSPLTPSHKLLSHTHVYSFCFVTYWPGGHLSDYGRELKALFYQN